MRDLSFDIVVIGAGIAGASAAWALAGRHRVLLLEAEDQPGYHSTGRSVAILSRTYGSSQVRALTAASLSFLQEAPGGFAEHPLLTPRGLMFVAAPGELHQLDAHAAKARAVGVPVERVDAAAIIAEIPVLRPERVGAGLREPGAADIDVAALHGGYLRGAKVQGARIISGSPVTAIERNSGGWRVEAGGQEYAAGLIVNAAGAWADAVAIMAGVKGLGITPLARTVATFDPAPDVDSRDWPMVMAADHSLYFKPESGRMLVSLSDEQPAHPGDVQAEELHIAQLVDRVDRMTTMAPRRLHSRWAGLRSFAPDRDLVCGRDTIEPAFFWLAGQGGFGIQTAPACAAMTAALIEDRELPPELAAAGVDPAAMSPARF